MPKTLTFFAETCATPIVWTNLSQDCIMTPKNTPSELKLCCPLMEFKSVPENTLMPMELEVLKIQTCSKKSIWKELLLLEEL